MFPAADRHGWTKLSNQTKFLLPTWRDPWLRESRWPASEFQEVTVTTSPEDIRKDVIDFYGDLCRAGHCDRTCHQGT